MFQTTNQSMFVTSLRRHATSWKIMENSESMEKMKKSSAANDISPTYLLFIVEPLLLFEAEPLLLVTADFKSTVSN